MDDDFVFSPQGMDRKAQGRAAHPVGGNTQAHLFPEGDASMTGPTKVKLCLTRRTDAFVRSSMSSRIFLERTKMSVLRGLLSDTSSMDFRRESANLIFQVDRTLSGYIRSALALVHRVALRDPVLCNPTLSG